MKRKYEDWNPRAASGLVVRAANAIIEEYAQQGFELEAALEQAATSDEAATAAAECGTEWARRAKAAEALLSQARQLLERSQHFPEESYAAAEHCEQWDHDARALLAAIAEVIR